MRLKLIFFIAIFLFLTFDKVEAQVVVGKWKTYDIFDKTKEESIVDVYIVDNHLFVRIYKIIPREHVNDICVNCTGKQKDQPILGMVILEGASYEDGAWKGAKILNAKNGKRYGCHISVETNDLLKVRGFVGYPIFGKTLYWTRVKDNEFK
jgi:uncharacterized protein (DUF2147 family)